MNVLRLHTAAILATAALVSGCSGTDIASESNSSIPPSKPVAIGEVANEGSNLVVDNKGRTYVVLAYDGEGTGQGKDQKRTGEGGREDTAANQAQLVRLTPSGMLDRSFGKRGRVSLKFEDGDYSSFTPQRLAADPDGNLLIAGSVDVDPAQTEERESGYGVDSTPENLGLIKTDAEGAPDTAFGSDGSLALSLADIKLTKERLTAVALLPDDSGTTISVERTGYNGTGSSFVRITPDGQPDRKTWNEGSDDQFDKGQRDGFTPVGMAQSEDLTTFYGYLDGIGKLSPVGAPATYDEKEYIAVPYTVNYSNRSIRSPNGLRSFSVLESGDVVGAHVLNNDKEVVNSSFVTKQDSAGKTVTSFGAAALKDSEVEHHPEGKKSALPPNDGVTWFNHKDQIEMAQSLLVTSNESIYVAGSGGDNSEHVRIVKLTKSGKLDEEWGDDGTASAEFSIADKYMYRQPYVEGMQLLKDGSLLALVSQQSGTFFGRTVYRFTSEGELDERWGDQGESTIRPTYQKR